MVFQYHRKTNNRQWSEEDMNDAALAVIEGEKCATVAAAMGLPRSTLQRKVKLLIEGEKEKIKKKPGAVTVFTKDQETDLSNTLLYHMHGMKGFTSDEVRSLACQLAEKLKIPHKFNRVEEMAGKDWYAGFMHRHPHLGLRKPENTSRNRAEAFNKKNVNDFYDLLEETIKKNNILPQNMYNVDETPVPTVPKSAPKVVAAKGQKQVGGLVSGERGEHITAEICFSATGSYMHPLLIFPRKNRNPEMCNGAPPGAIIEFHPTGYIQKEIFFKWFQKFIDYAKPAPDKQVLLILDQHSTHTQNLEVLELAKESNVIILALPPHTSHKLQPVDLTFNKSLSSNFGKEHSKWLKVNKNKIFNLKTFFDVFTPAYIASATPDKAVNGFRKAGIWPFNRNIYKDTDFTCASEDQIPNPLDKKFSEAIHEILAPSPEDSNTAPAAELESGLIDKASAASDTVNPETEVENVAVNNLDYVNQAVTLSEPVTEAVELNFLSSEDIYSADIEIVESSMILDGNSLTAHNSKEVTATEGSLPQIVDVSSIVEVPNSVNGNSPVLNSNEIPASIPAPLISAVSPNNIALTLNESSQSCVDLQSTKENNNVITSKKRKSLKSKTKIVNSEENLKLLRDSKEIAESKKPKNPRKRKTTSLATTDIKNQQLTAVSLQLNTPAINPYFYPSMNCPYPWPPYYGYPATSFQYPTSVNTSTSQPTFLPTSSNYNGPIQSPLITNHVLQNSNSINFQVPTAPVNLSLGSNLPTSVQ